MITKEPQNGNSAKLSATIKARTLQELNRLAKETGNRSFIVNKALEEYIGLEEEPEQKAS